MILFILFQASLQVQARTWDFGACTQVTSGPTADPFASSTKWYDANYDPSMLQTSPLSSIDCPVTRQYKVSPAQFCARNNHDGSIYWDSTLKVSSAEEVCTFPFAASLTDRQLSACRRLQTLDADLQREAFIANVASCRQFKKAFLMRKFVPRCVHTVVEFLFFLNCFFGYRFIWLLGCVSMWTKQEHVEVSICTIRKTSVS